MVSAQDERHDAEQNIADARDAGLRYVATKEAGITRLKHGRGFRYVDADNNPITDARIMERIKALAVPPAWTDVWICASANGHIQATGRDERGRKQYCYHAKWRAHRDESKFDELLAFGKALPAIRKRLRKDLRGHGMPEEKILAGMTLLLDETGIRVGNDEYTRDNGSFGLTTLRNRHVEVTSGTITLTFRGKGRKAHVITLHSAPLARVVKRCRDLPGQRLFQYVDVEGTIHAIDSGAINDYLCRISGTRFTAKVFRTWTGTVLATAALRVMPAPDSEDDANRAILQAVDDVAAHLGNTRAIARKSYIHPAVLDSFRSGRLHELAAGHSRPVSATGLDDDEQLTLRILDG